MMELIYREEVYALIGACFEVYNELGSREIPFVEKPKLPIHYKRVLLTKKYEPDFVSYEKIIMEIKAVSALADEHRAQVHNYLKASSFKAGLLVNFGRLKTLEHKRIVR
jgi:GxxExxY protein